MATKFAQDRDQIRRKLKRMHNRSRNSFLGCKLPQVTKPGMYWFTDDSEKKWLVQIMDDGTASKLEMGTLYPFTVDSLGIGEFIGPISI